jgi:uncharacterized SAM-binding protein YcdF (DUF218 family)
MTAAERIFEYLCVRDEAFPNADLVIGFGHFDLRVPRLCGALYESGRAARVLLTGGCGAGTADLPDAEAVVFLRVLTQAHPAIPTEHICVESASTNTGENIRFGGEALQRADPSFCFESGIRSVIAVASPYRQRRVWRTMRLFHPSIRVFNSPPPTSFEEELRLFASKGQDLVSLLLGELERIMSYPAKGYMAPDAIPPDVMSAKKIIEGMDR